MSPPQEPLLLEPFASTSTTCPDNSSAALSPYSQSNDFKLNDLVKSIHDVLGDEGLDSEKIDAEQIIQLMKKYSSNSVDWNKYTLFDHSRAYTRNLIDDGNGKVMDDELRPGTCLLNIF
jgi:cysteine dioxygenase